jgi:hypothetical protein
MLQFSIKPVTLLLFAAQKQQLSLLLLSLESQQRKEIEALKTQLSSSLTLGSGQKIVEKLFLSSYFQFPARKRKDKKKKEKSLSLSVNFSKRRQILPSSRSN